MRKFISIILALAFDASPLAAGAQSFSCAKSVTLSEKLICADSELSNLDSELAAIIRRALRVLPARRDALLAQERLWVAQRDRQCGDPTNVARDNGLSCLKQAYQNRIEIIKAKIPEETPDKSLCQRLVDLYKSAGAADADDWVVPRVEKSGGLSGSKSSAPFSNPTGKDLLEWARHEKPPFDMPQDLIAEITRKETNSALRIDRLPGTGFYSAYIVAGALNCYNSVYFLASSGHARRLEDDAAFPSGEGDGCAVARSFATLHNKPVAIEEDETPYAPTLPGAVRIQGWATDHFLPACVAHFDFAPRFDAQGPISHSSGEKEACNGPDCESLRQAAALAQLSPTQTAQFAASADPETKEDGDKEIRENPDDLTDKAPLSLPLLHNGRVYRASIGHTTMGWRTWKDWTVKFESDENGAPKVAVFDIGMGRGRLLNAKVE